MRTYKIKDGLSADTYYQQTQQYFSVKLNNAELLISLSEDKPYLYINNRKYLNTNEEECYTVKIHNKNYDIISASQLRKFFEDYSHKKILHI